MAVAKDVMTTNPVTCQNNRSIRDAVEIMKREDTGIVPIVDSDNQIRGVVTDRDICLQIVLQNLSPENTSLEEVMQHTLITCEQDEELDEIINKMKQAQVKRILVVENAQCVGIISESDIARNVGSQPVGELAKAVYQ